MQIMLKKGDMVVFLIVTALILGSFFGVKIYNSRVSGNGKVAVIRQNNKIIKTIDLNKLKESETIEIDGDFHNKILAENGKIRFEAADCPDQVCVKTGWLEFNGEMAVCLPNKVSVKIEGGNDNGLDGVAY